MIKGGFTKKTTFTLTESLTLLRFAMENGRRTGVGILYFTYVLEYHEVINQ
jgi:hypothetical protein